MNVAFTGYYGMRSFGDDLFGVLCAAAARHFWNCMPMLVGPPVPGADSVATMPPGYPPERYGAPGIIGKATRLYSLAQAMVRADILVMGGGSVLSHGSLRKGMMRVARRASGLRLAAMGVSVGPFRSPDDEIAAARFIAGLDFLTVRDGRSYRTAERMGFGPTTHNGRDLAGLLPLFEKDVVRDVRERRKDGTLRIGIAPCEYDEALPDRMRGKEETLAALLHALQRRADCASLRIDVFSLNGHPVDGDAALADRLHSRLQEMGLVGQRIRYGATTGRGPLALAREIACCDAFVSARLHGAIAAYLQDVPVTLIEYHPKCRDFADDVGLPHAQRIFAGRNGVDAFGEALSSMLDARADPLLPADRYAEGAAAMFRLAPWSRPWEDVPRPASVQDPEP